MKFSIKPLIIYCFVQLIFLATADAKDELPAAKTKQALQQNIQTIAEKNKLPSVAYALVSDQKIIQANIFGFADLEQQKPATENTLYRIGSVSKMFTAIAVLKLIEQGRLNLEDEVRTLVPEVKFTNPWQQSHPIRVIHLLEHTTGWDELALSEYAKSNTAEQTLIDSLNFYPESRTSRWPPGTRSAYSNSGAAVAAYIIEKITGEQFESFVQKNIFNPLALNDTSYLYNQQVKSHGATSYKGKQAQAYKHLIYRPAGAINSTLFDMAKLTQMLINQGAPILTEQSISLMQQSHSKNTNVIETSYGLNNSPAVYNQRLYHGHGGAINGALAELRYLQNEKLGFVLFINSSNKRAFKQIREQIVNFQTQSLSANTENDTTQSITINDKLDGYYYTVNPRFELAHFFNRLVAVYKVRTTTDQLSLSGLIFNAKPQIFTASSQSSFKSTENGLVTLASANDPIAGSVLHFNDKVLQKTSAISVYSQLVIALLWLICVISLIVVLLLRAINKFRGKTIPIEDKYIASYSLLATSSALFFIALMVLGMQNPNTHFGGIGVFSLGIMLASICYTAFTLVACYRLSKANFQSCSKPVFSYHAVCACAHALVCSYLLYFGIIGVRVWA